MKGFRSYLRESHLKDSFKRRQLLQWLGMGAIGALLPSGCRSIFQTANPQAANTGNLIAIKESVITQSLPQSPPQQISQFACTPTPPDMLGPFYVPGAPVRSKVGTGHLLRGVVRSSTDCAVIAKAKIEFWQTGPDGAYGDAHRATIFSGESGVYQFESNFPPPYAQRPSHIHLRISADGYETLVTQYYPSQGQTEGAFDLVLIPVG